MDLSNIDMNALAKQLRFPEGDFGVKVGQVMAKNTLPLNMFAIEQLNMQPTDHVLEIGFGPGEALAEVVRLTPRGYVAGIDHSQTMLTMAEERNHRAIMQEHVELTLGDASALPYPSESFHKVFAVNVFHFWPDPSIPLAECMRVLKPGGMVLFFLTHPTSWPKGLAESGVFIAREPEEIEEIMTDAGFKNVETRLFTFQDQGGKGFAMVGWGK